MKRFLKMVENYLKTRAKTRGYTCDCCGTEVFRYPTERVCETCFSDLYGEQTPRCEKCGRKTYVKGICLTCKSRVPAFYKGYSPFVYAGKTASLVNRLKTGDKRIAFFLGEEIAKTFLSKVQLPDLFLSERGEDSLLLIPIPLTVTRRKERGYNQAEELAFSIACVLEKAGYAVELGFDILQRLKDGEMQKHLNFASRVENVSGVYHVHKRKSCKDRTVLLIDDVLTTGATGSECAKRLMGAGAKRVYFLTCSAVPEQK